MKNLIKLLNHDLTDAQKKELQQDWSVGTIFSLPQHLQKIWSEVNPEVEIDMAKTELLEKWIKVQLKAGDLLLIQGEFGLAFYFVDFAFQNGFVPIYAATKRVYSEKKKLDGSVNREHVFKHVRFKQYRKY